VSWFREWLEGAERPAGSARPAAPSAPASRPHGDADGPGSYPGERFGLPEAGPGSVATLARRGGQFFLDALLAGVLAAIFTYPGLPQNWSLLTWAIIMIVPVAVVGATPAMALLGLRVVRLDRPGTAGVGLLWTLVRTVSVFFVIPALILDRDSRGIHDRASRTIVVRTR
jgi:uncharacterized RDD family membrane protein YckC